MGHSVSFGRLALLGVLMPILCRSVPARAQDRSTTARAIPNTWDGKALAEWATPLGGINVRPSHISSALSGNRRSDEALYALALYTESLKPLPNPNPVNADSEAGERIFLREGCTGCLTPPLYTDNKLELAECFTPPRDLPSTLDVLPVSVRTDPGLALRTRKGSGFYKAPSLRGLWYRGHYLHDGSVASLEEMFDPDRVKDSHTPGGYSPPGIRNRAIKGHEFGLALNERERSQLIAFLRRFDYPNRAGRDASRKLRIGKEKGAPACTECSSYFRSHGRSQS
jgi:hypothetical protein